MSAAVLIVTLRSLHGLNICYFQGVRTETRASSLPEREGAPWSPAAPLDRGRSWAECGCLLGGRWSGPQLQRGRRAAAGAPRLCCPVSRGPSTAGPVHCAPIPICRAGKARRGAPPRPRASRAASAGSAARPCAVSRLLLLFAAQALARSRPRPRGPTAPGASPTPVGRSLPNYTGRRCPPGILMGLLVPTGQSEGCAARR